MAPKVRVADEAAGASRGIGGRPSDAERRAVRSHAVEPRHPAPPFEAEDLLEATRAFEKEYPERKPGPDRASIHRRMTHPGSIAAGTRR